MTEHLEELRERVVDAYDVLGRPPRAELEALVDLTAKVTGMPMAAINLFTPTEQWQVATHGFDASVCAREDSLCRITLEDERPVLVPDVSRDERFRGNPFTTGELGSVRFYASYPLATPEGVVFGTLCVFDETAHDVAPDLEHTLSTLAAQVVHDLQLELTSRELRAANDRLAAFAGQVSHDLKNPLSAIRMSLELVREELGQDADEVLGSLLERSLRGTSRMEVMIDDLLRFARVGTSPEVTEVELATLLAEVVADLGEEVAPPGRVRWQELPKVRADAVQLRVVLQNLVANAIKFSPWDTEVEVGADRLPAGWRVTVADRGPGVPPDQRERVFDPMVRLDSAVPGSGIGLATCRRIVAAHAGQVGIDDRVGGGSVVWFELPVRSDPM